jgi:hypothetical protein
VLMFHVKHLPGVIRGEIDSDGQKDVSRET